MLFLKMREIHDATQKKDGILHLISPSLFREACQIRMPSIVSLMSVIYMIYIHANVCIRIQQLFILHAYPRDKNNVILHLESRYKQN